MTARYSDAAHRTILDDVDPRDIGGDISGDGAYLDDYLGTESNWPPRSGTLHSGRSHSCKQCGKCIAQGEERWSNGIACVSCAALATLRKEGLL